MATELAKAYVQIVPSAQGISGKIGEAIGGEASSAGAKAGNDIAGSLGKTLKGALVKLGIGKLIMDSIGNASEFETGMAKVSTLFSGTNEEFKQLTDDILGLSGAYGISTKELTEAAYSAESAGVKQEDLLYMLEHSAQLAKAGFTDLDTALSATAKTMNAYGDAAGSAEDVQRVLMQTQNLGITTVGELGASLANVTPTAAAMGVSFEQVGAAMAQMTAAGVPTAQATTQLRAAMSELGKKGTKADKAFRAAAKGTKYAGMSFQQAMEKGATMGDVFGMMQAYADKTGKSMVDLWGSVEAGNAAMMIASDLDTFNSNLEAMGTDADVVGDAYGKMSSTLGDSMNRLKESAKNFMTALFTGGDVSASFKNMLNSLGDVGKKLITWLSTGLKTLGESLPELMTELIDFAGSLIKSLGEVNWIEVATTLVTGIIGAAGALGTGIVNLITGAISTLCGGEGGEGGENNFADLGSAILGGVTGVLDAGGQWLSTLFTAGKTAVEAIDFGALGTTIFSALTSVLDAGGQFLSNLFTTGLDTAKEQDWPTIGETIKTAVNLALNGGKFLSAIFEAGATMIQAINWSNVGTQMENLIVAGLSAGASIVDAIGKSATALLTGVDWGSIGSSAGALVTAGLNGATDIVKSVSTAASSLVTGIQWEKIGKDSSTLLCKGLEGAANLLSAGFSGAVSFLEGVNWAELGGKISNGLGSALEGVGGFLGGLFGGAGKTLEGAGDLAGKGLTALGDALFGSDIDQMKKAAEELNSSMISMESALTTGKATAVKAAAEIGKGIYEAISTAAGPEAMSAVGTNVVTGIINGITGQYKNLVTPGTSILKILKSGVTGGEGSPAWKTIGGNIVAGIIKGINDKKEQLKSTMTTLATEALAAAKAALGIESPSKVMRDRVGRWIPEGIAAGIKQYGGLVDDAMGSVTSGLSSTTIKTTLTDQSTGAYASGLGYGFDMLSNGINSAQESANKNALEQNELLREQNRLLRLILGKTGSSAPVNASVSLGRTVNRSLEMLQMVGG